MTCCQVTKQTNIPFFSPAAVASPNLTTVLDSPTQGRCRDCQRCRSHRRSCGLQRCVRSKHLAIDSVCCVRQCSVSAGAGSRFTAQWLSLPRCFLAARCQHAGWSLWRLWRQSLLSKRNPSRRCNCVGRWGGPPHKCPRLRRQSWTRCPRS